MGGINSRLAPPNPRVRVSGEAEREERRRELWLSHLPLVLQPDGAGGRLFLAQIPGLVGRALAAQTPKKGLHPIQSRMLDN